MTPTYQTTNIPLWHEFIDMWVQFWPNHRVPLGGLYFLHILYYSIPSVLSRKGIFMVTNLDVFFSSSTYSYLFFLVTCKVYLGVTPSTRYKLTIGLLKNPSLLHF